MYLTNFNRGPDDWMDDVHVDRSSVDNFLNSMIYEWPLTQHCFLRVAPSMAGCQKQ